MRDVGVKAKKISTKKAVLIVKFVLMPSLKDVHIQLFCTSLESKTTQGHDLGILTALKTTAPGASAKIPLRPWRAKQTTLRLHT